jgi:hypothetical protein
MITCSYIDVTLDDLAFAVLTLQWKFSGTEKRQQAMLSGRHLRHSIVQVNRETETSSASQPT